MPEYVPMYCTLVQMIYNSNSYCNATEEQKREVNDWLVKPEVVDFFAGKLIRQLTLRESLIEGFSESDAFKKRTSEEQRIIEKYLNSSTFKMQVDRLEKSCLEFGQEFSQHYQP